MLLNSFPCFFFVCLPFIWLLLSTERKEKNVQFAKWDQRRHGWGRREASVCSWKEWDIQKISAPSCEKLILPTHLEDVLLWRLFATYLTHPSFIFIHCVVLLSCRPNAAFLILLNTYPLFNEPEVHFGLVIGVFINYRLQSETVWQMNGVIR